MLLSGHTYAEIMYSILLKNVRVTAAIGNIEKWTARVVNHPIVSLISWKCKSSDIFNGMEEVDRKLAF